MMRLVTKRLRADTAILMLTLTTQQSARKGPHDTNFELLSAAVHKMQIISTRRGSVPHSVNYRRRCCSGCAGASTLTTTCTCDARRRRRRRRRTGTEPRYKNN
ncbi:hypothetical protein MSG28_007832 [Choristoneura fumiferana]|uniref:Uncharacterized protein n=1 Tax=Choristoneura fumiferana TaxID=7141 RepID=A0ACC0J997_CHOFU|nr:hypothetical protein MSG28_007832 [Choristoneura fumiferana]